MSSRVLVTGGLGYIGSHTVVKLINLGHEVVILDNLSNSHESVISRIETITGVRPDFYLGDIRERKILKTIFKDKNFDALFHFAGLKSVGESETNPLIYFDNNVSGSIILFDEAIGAGVNKIIFSSSATVYGLSSQVRYSEFMALNPINVYGKTKLMVENILRDLKKSNFSIGVAILRYFNPVGAHPSGILGEKPMGTPNNLMPFIADVASGRRDKLFIYGNDYPTPDGTGLRDYIHVEDLASGHLAALDYITSKNDLIALNLGSGKTISVLEMLKAFENVTGKSIPYEFAMRRSGDLAEYFADPTLANDLIGWRSKLGITEICEDTWRWQMNLNKFSSQS